MDEPDHIFAEFVAARSAALFRLAYLLTGDRDRAEDLLQTTLANCYASWGRIASKQAVEAYVQTALVRTNISWARRRRLAEVPLFAIAEPAISSPQHALDERDEAWRLLQRLPPRQRAVLVLRYYEDLTDARIAEVLRCSSGTVRSQASRALSKLRRDMDSAGAASGSKSLMGDAS